MKFLIFGDVSGRLGREGITKILPELKAKHQPDSVIINIENIAHGKGISPQTMQEALSWKADVHTTGDHAWDNAGGIPLLEDKSTRVIRPANYGNKVPGRGWHVYSVGAFQVAVINLQGQVMFRNDPENPFHWLDNLLTEPEIKAAHIRLVDFHAEATSEKRALGWHADGRVTAVWGTHTHVPTADAQILPQGTGYITDIGMNAGYKSIIGMDIKGPMNMFLTQIKDKMEPPSEGPIEINALVLEADPQTGKTTSIALERKILENN